MPGAVILRRTSMFSTLFTRKPESTNTSTPLPAGQDDLKGIRPKSFEVTVTGGLDGGVIHGQITGDHDLQPRRGTVPSKKYSPRPSLAEERVCSALKSCS
jgi:hypothetical protein